MLNQARFAGMGGFVGFDYSCLPAILIAKNVPRSEWGFTVDKLQAVQVVAVERFGPKED